jgi:hypothetical protein
VPLSKVRRRLTLLAVSRDHHGDALARPGHRFEDAYNKFFLSRQSRSGFRRHIDGRTNIRFQYPILRIQIAESAV